MLFIRKNIVNQVSCITLFIHEGLQVFHYKSKQAVRMQSKYIIAIVHMVVGMPKLYVHYAPINVSPHPPTRDRVGNFPCLEWQACPRGRDIESLKCACETHAARVQSRF